MKKMAKNGRGDTKTVLDILDGAVLTVGVFLRSIAPGFVALFVLILTHKDFHEVLGGCQGGCPEWVIFSGVILTGFLIQAVHSPVIVRPLWYLVVLLHRKFDNNHLKDYYKLKGDQLTGRSTWAVMSEMDIERWKRRASRELHVAGFQRELDAWGGLQNLLYTTSYITISLPLLLRWLCPGSLRPKWWYLEVLGLAFLIVSLISEFRGTNMEFWACAEFFGGRSTDARRAVTAREGANASSSGSDVQPEQ